MPRSVALGGPLSRDQDVTTLDDDDAARAACYAVATPEGGTRPLMRQTSAAGYNIKWPSCKGGNEIAYSRAGRVGLAASRVITGMSAFFLY